MPLPPRIDYSGQKATITMMEFSNAPGDVIERVERGMEITVTKNGKPVAVLLPPDTVIRRDGSITGRKPLTMGLHLGGEYAELDCDYMSGPCGLSRGHAGPCAGWPSKHISATPN